MKKKERERESICYSILQLIFYSLIVKEIIKKEYLNKVVKK